MGAKSEATYNVQNEWRSKLFLTPQDLMLITDSSESLIYKYLENPPFRTERIGGKKIVIFANSFWKWYDFVSFPLGSIGLPYYRIYYRKLHG